MCFRLCTHLYFVIIVGGSITHDKRKKKENFLLINFALAMIKNKLIELAA